MLNVLLTSFNECASKVCLKGLELSWLRTYWNKILLTLKRTIRFLYTFIMLSTERFYSRGWQKRRFPGAKQSGTPTWTQSYCLQTPIWLPDLKWKRSIMYQFSHKTFSHKTFLKHSDYRVLTMSKRFIWEPESCNKKKSTVWVGYRIRNFNSGSRRGLPTWKSVIKI